MTGSAPIVEPRASRRRRAAPGLTTACIVLLALAASSAHGSQWFVETNGLQFTPQFLTIEAGDSVTFLNRGGYHNVVADDGSFRCAHGCDGDSGGGNGNATSTPWIVTLTFPAPGTIGYFCEPHGAPGSGMYGTIEVVAAPPPPTLAPAPSGNLRLYVLLSAVIAAVAMRRLRGA